MIIGKTGAKQSSAVDPKKLAEIKNEVKTMNNSIMMSELSAGRTIKCPKTESIMYTNKHGEAINVELNSGNIKKVTVDKPNCVLRPAEPNPNGIEAGSKFNLYN